tara:strand:+ start:1303 stop:2406 length:1104 start_codon:yes stop_codon:yes gene_type:complete
MKNKSKIRIIISGGGTAGHIFPALSIADYIKKEYNSDFLFIGARKRMEIQKVQKSGYKISAIWIDGLQRKFSFRNLILPLKLFVSFFQSLYYLITYRPNIVIGTGGFVSGPVLFTASLIGIPTLIHEQNSFPGITNKILSKFVNTVCVSYPGFNRFFKNRKVVFSGNPVRKKLKEKVSKKKSAAYFKLRFEEPIILIIGGSLGAEPINKIICKHLGLIKKESFQLIWQTGNFHYQKYKHLESYNVKIFNFIDHMNFAYAAADIVISRAGAIAISEICLLKKASILIPSPHVSENHQYENAKSLADNLATCLIKEKSLEKLFWDKLKYLINDEGFRKKMSDNAFSFGHHNAEKIITEEVVRLLDSQVI